MIKITPNEIQRLKPVLSELVKDQPVNVKFKFATTIKRLDDHMEVFRGQFNAPDLSAYYDEVKTVYGEDMKGKPQEKIDLLNTIKEKYKDAITEMTEFNKKFEKAAGEILELDNVLPISLGDLPETVTTEQLTILLPILKEDVA